MSGLPNDGRSLRRCRRSRTAGKGLRAFSGQTSALTATSRGYSPYRPRENLLAPNLPLAFAGRLFLCRFASREIVEELRQSL
jgi:hypothetical protein